MGNAMCHAVQISPLCRMPCPDIACNHNMLVHYSLHTRPCPATCMAHRMPATSHPPNDPVTGTPLTKPTIVLYASERAPNDMGELFSSLPDDKKLDISDKSTQVKHEYLNQPMPMLRHAWSSGHAPLCTLLHDPLSATWPDCCHWAGLVKLGPAPASARLR